MKRSQVRNRMLLTYVASYLLMGSLAARSLPLYLGTEYFQVVVGLLLIFFILFTSERVISRFSTRYIHFYFGLQVLVTLILLISPPPFDYFAILVIPLCIQAFWILPQRPATIWTGIFAFVVSASLIDSYGWVEGSGYALAYLAVLFFITVFGVVVLRAEKAQAESQALLEQLQTAHDKLREYAGQAEELAAAQERALLARELHDSVTQTIFSMTLTAQAARILLDRDPQRVPAQLEHLQELAQNALAEMRSLIQQLRSKEAPEEGLGEVLRAHFRERQRKDGLTVDFSLDCERRLPNAVEQIVYRVVQEALNNVVKHAHTDRATVTLCLERNPVSVEISDQGVGFDPKTVPQAPGHLGLSSMSERIQSLGGTLTIDSGPGSGTKVRAENIWVEET